MQHVTPAQNAVPAIVNGNSVSGIKDVSFVVLEEPRSMILVTYSAEHCIWLLVIHRGASLRHSSSSFFLKS